jgi:FtsH-binding integral membrane protein
VDQGLRPYMLRIYNYMVIGLAITGFAALGIYMLSVTPDASAAAQGVTSVARGMFLTPLGYALFVSPLNGP